jgi:hypothetical protein
VVRRHCGEGSLCLGDTVVRGHCDDNAL